MTSPLDDDVFEIADRARRPRRRARGARGRRGRDRERRGRAAPQDARAARRGDATKLMRLDRRARGQRRRRRRCTRTSTSTPRSSNAWPGSRFRGGRRALASPPMLPPALREPGPFRLLFWGQALSVIGDRITPVAIAFAVLGLGSATRPRRSSLAAGGVPFALFALAGGVLADRLGRRRVMIASDLRARGHRRPSRRRCCSRAPPRSGCSPCSPSSTGPRPRSSCPR